MKLGLAFALVLACGDNIDADGRSHGLEDKLTEWLTSKGALHGTVYRCESGAMCLSETGEPATEEWCWAGDEVDLEHRLGVDAYGCWAIQADERWWPWFAGCAWCPSDGAGCNAHCGCIGCES